MAAPAKKEAPAEPFKRVLGLAVRAIAGDSEVQVSYGPGKPELDGKAVQLPEPSRVPSQREVAVIRGWADSLALTAAWGPAAWSPASLAAAATAESSRSEAAWHWDAKARPSKWEEPSGMRCQAG